MFQGSGQAVLPVSGVHVRGPQTLSRAGGDTVHWRQTDLRRRGTSCRQRRPAHADVAPDRQLKTRSKMKPWVCCRRRSLGHPLSVIFYPHGARYFVFSRFDWTFLTCSSLNQNHSCAIPYRLNGRRTSVRGICAGLAVRGWLYETQPYLCTGGGGGGCVRGDPAGPAPHSRPYAAACGQQPAAADFSLFRLLVPPY